MADSEDTHDVDSGESKESTGAAPSADSVGEPEALDHDSPVASDADDIEVGVHMPKAPKLPKVPPLTVGELAKSMSGLPKYNMTVEAVKALPGVSRPSPAVEAITKAMSRAGGVNELTRSMEAISKANKKLLAGLGAPAMKFPTVDHPVISRDYVSPAEQQTRLLREMGSKQNDQTQLLGNLVAQEIIQTGVLKDLASKSDSKWVNRIILAVAVLTLLTGVFLGVRGAQSNSASKQSPTLASPAAKASQTAP